jgi:hypothetical protein
MDWGLVLALAGAAMGALPAARSQEHLINAPEPSQPIKEHALPDRLPAKPSQPPAFSVPVEALGFAAPGPLYLGQQNSLVSLDFLDEDHLLFTFRVPGLMRREEGASDARRIRAVVLELPSGTVGAEALWTVHDRARYLWMLKDGRFLLRDRENLESGDKTLQLKPFLHFPGALLWLEIDPAQQYMVTGTREPASADGAPSDLPTRSSAPDLALRILRRDSGQVLLTSRVRSALHLPINSDGYLESLRGTENEWLLNLNYFSGGSRILARIDSACSPLFDFVGPREILATYCSPAGAGEMALIRDDGRRLWQVQTSEMAVWPLVVKAPDGSRMAREALAVTHAVTASSPLGQEDIKGQLVEVLDTADGKVELETEASPVFDAGGNVAISPSGRRVAVLNGGAIQIFELPAPPPLPQPVARPVLH